MVKEIIILSKMDTHSQHPVRPPFHLNEHGLVIDPQKNSAVIALHPHAAILDMIVIHYRSPRFDV